MITTMFTSNRDLFHQDQVPEHFKELFIVSGYRSPKSSLSQCFFSVFEATNETLNFWTHFVPAVYFWYVTYRMGVEFNFAGDVYTWPLATYMLGLCLFPLTSAVAHLFNTISDRARHICFFFDYAALSIFTMGASIAYKEYIFPATLIGGLFHTLFLPIASVNAVISLILCCQSRFMEQGLKKKVMRISAFSIPYFFDSAPMFYRIFYCTTESSSRALEPHTYQFVFGFLSAVMYISHMPERLFPGRFDIVGHSHQLFHVFTVIAAHLQMNGLTMDMVDRRDELRHLKVIPTQASSLALFLSVIAITVLVLAVFVNKIYHVTPDNPTWRHLYGHQSYHQVNANDVSKSMNSDSKHTTNSDHVKAE